MTFWRQQVIDFALDHETRRQMEEQVAWIRREPQNARPYYHLAQFYRICGRAEEARGLLLEAVRLDPTFAEAHVSLAEMYAIAAEYPAAWHHARQAAAHGLQSAMELLDRYHINEP